MKASNPALESEDGFSLDSMLDIVFLLLIYFMVTAAFVKEDILADGTVMLNGQPYDAPENHDLPQLTTILTRFRQASADAKVPAFIIVQAVDEARQQRVIDVLNACAVAGITLVSFNLE